LGITPEILQPTAKTASSGAGASSLCFEAPSSYELGAQGKKLVGSAQLRRFGGLLQHGSLLLRIDRAHVARLVPGTRQGVLQSAPSREEALGRPVPFEEGAAALQEGFARALGWRLEPWHLTGEEAQLAWRLEVAKYATPAWTWDGME